MAMMVMTAFVTADEKGASSLVRQQSATIESLQNEVLRLNQELEGSISGRRELQAVIPELEKTLAGAIALGDIQIVMDPRGLVITVRDHALFDPDGPRLTPAGEVILGKIATFLSRDLADHKILLEGHTDDQPVENSGDVTNWEYSVARACVVLRYLVDGQNIFPERLGVVGYSEYRPVDTNATEEGRDRNRRVEIVILPQRVSDAPSR